MDELNFKLWLNENGKTKKVQSDMISRLKALQRELLGCDIDKEYEKNKCKKLILALKNKGINDTMKSYGDVNLPIGKYSLATYRYALNNYIKFKNEYKK